MVCADTVIKDLIENLIRGCRLNQYGIGDAQEEMIMWLVYARAALLQDCNVSDGFSRVKKGERNMDEKGKTRFVTLKKAAEQTGLPERYLRELYRFPGQNFAVKRDPRKEKSRIYYDLDLFYKWLEKANRRQIGRERG